MITHCYPGHDSDEGHGSPMSESPLINALLAGGQILANACNGTHAVKTTFSSLINVVLREHDVMRLQIKSCSEQHGRH
jgi:hypothetical protein